MPFGLDRETPLHVAFIHRRPIEGNYSIESYFQRIGASLQAMGVNLQNHTSPETSRGLLPRLRIIRFAQQHQAAITHITGDIHFAALGTDPKRTIVTVHDCGRLHQLRGLPREVLRQFWFALPLQPIAAITVVSQAVKDDLLRWVPALEPERIHVIPVCISPQFTFSAKSFPTSNARILQVGTAPNKNLPRLIEALQGLDITLVVIGPLEESLRQLLAQHRIRYETHRNLSEPEVVSLYRSVDLVAFASTLEGFGMPILEAQATGRPVLTSNCASMPDVAGGGALLVDPTSVASIRAGLQRLLQDPTCRQELIERGLANVRRFSASEIAGQYLQLYQSLAA
jgi:glycosyltransferase involved in cell wall biosynthesis